MNKLKFTIQLLIVVCLLAGSITAHSQIVTTPKFEWANNVTSMDSYINPQLVGRDALGGVISVGNYWPGTADFDPGTGVHNMTNSSLAPAVYIMKYTEEGVFQWVKQLVFENFSDLSGYIFGVTSLTVNERTGDMYITGEFSDSTIDFDPGPGVARMVPEIFTMAGTFGQSIYILKLNAAGEFQWVKQITTYNPGYVTSGVVDPGQGESGKIYFTGFITPAYDDAAGGAYAIDFNPNSGTAFLTPKNTNNSFGFVLSLSGEGEYISAFKIGNDDSAAIYANDIVQDKEGSLYVSGNFWGTTDVDPSSGVHNITSKAAINLANGYIIKYTPSGAFQWVKQTEPGIMVINGLEQAASMLLTSMGVDTANGLYITARLNGPSNFDKEIAYGGKATLLDVANSSGTLSQSPATAIVKYNTVSGTLEWVKQIGGFDTTNRAQFPVGSVAKDGSIFVSGSYTNKVDFDPGADSFILSGQGTYIAKYDAEGGFLWGGNLAEGAAETSANSKNIKAGDTGNVYVVGDYAYGSMDFDPTPATFLLTPLSITGAFMVKLNVASIDTTSPPDTATNINKRELSVRIRVYPNPTMGLLDIASDQSLNNGTMIITNVAGQVVFQRAHLQGSRFNFDLQELASGTYFLEIGEGVKRNTYKLVKQ